MPKPRRTPLADILARHNLLDAGGLALCLEEAVAAYDAEVLDEPIDARCCVDLPPESPTGDDYNAILDLVATVIHHARATA